MAFDDSAPPITCPLEQPDPITLAGVQRIERHLHRRLLTKLGMFSTFEVRYGRPGALGDNVLGRYVEESCRQPIVLLDIHAHRRAAKQDRVNFWRLLRITICHELAHAIQEWHGLPFDNQKAEYFALGFVEIGVINWFWEKPDAAAVDDVPLRRWQGPK